jgi:hypothetical protein
MTAKTKASPRDSRHQRRAILPMMCDRASPTPLSIRFDAALLARLRRRAGATAGSTTSALAQRLIDEGLRMADHPGVIFKDGPSGRRAALAYGPDIWEIIKFLREVDERGPAALDAAAEVFAVDASRIATAVSYYGDYRDEIDTEISDADKASARAEEAWRVQRQLITCALPNPRNALNTADRIDAKVRAGGRLLEPRRSPRARGRRTSRTCGRSPRP